MIEHITYKILRIFSKILSPLSRKSVIVLGRSIGLFIYIFFPVRKKDAKINLNIVFPNKNKQQINSINRKTYMHNGVLMLELIKLHNYKPNNYIIDLDSNTERILSLNEGLIFMTAHIGAWEILVPIMREYKNLTLIVKEQKNSGGDRFFSECRKNCICPDFCRNTAWRPCCNAGGAVFHCT